MKTFLSLALPFVACAPLLACGGYYYESPVLSIDAQLAVLPENVFALEIEKLAPASEFKRPETPEADAFKAMLAAALTDEGRPENEIRGRVADYGLWRAAKTGPDGGSVRPALPAAFALYENGAEAFREVLALKKPEKPGDSPQYSPKTEGLLAEARKSWNECLALPPEKRRHIEAAVRFMLARASLEDGSPGDSKALIAAVRSAVRGGVPDPAGFAASCLQLDRRLAGDFPQQAENLLSQTAANTGRTLVDRELQLLCHGFLKSLPEREPGDAEITTTLASPRLRGLINAYILSKGGRFAFADPLADKKDPGTERWLRLQDGVPGPVPEAESIAAVAYRKGEYALASRWIAKADPKQPLTAIYASRLFLREGDPGRAAAALAACAEAPDAFSGPATKEEDRGDFSGWSHDPESSFYYSRKSTLLRRVALELALLRLRERRDADALVLFLRSGETTGPAFVAERRMTTAELWAFVDAHTGDTLVRPAFRELLARRLMREGRPDDAARYFSPENRLVFDAYREFLRTAYNGDNSAARRAEAFEKAADLLMEKGVLLFLAETAPERHIGVWSDMEVPKDLRESPYGSRRIPEPTRRDRVMRYRAGDLLWLAAGLLPNDDENTARLLLKAGRRHADNDDPATADLFYKSLVLRCPNTTPGREALRLHWLPKAS